MGVLLSKPEEPLDTSEQQRSSPWFPQHTSGKKRSSPQLPRPNFSLEQQFLPRPWREINWADNQNVLQSVKDYKPPTEGQIIRILLHGPVGSGKSSFINSVQSILHGRMYAQALTENVISGVFFTKKFNPGSKLSESDPDYIKSPTDNDRVHVLVCVFTALTCFWAPPEILQKIRDIRETASELGIPQVVVLTKIDEAHLEIKEDLKNVYKVIKLKEQMEKFSAQVGIPMNYIFPVKNYSEEINLNDDVDSLILSALSNIINSGEDYLNFH